MKSTNKTLRTNENKQREVFDRHKAERERDRLTAYIPRRIFIHFMWISMELGKVEFADTPTQSRATSKVGITTSKSVMSLLRERAGKMWVTVDNIKAYSYSATQPYTQSYTQPVCQLLNESENL